MKPLSEGSLFLTGIIFTLLFALFSCNENEDTKALQKNPDSISGSTKDSLLQITPLLAAKLCTLWVKKDSFLTLEKNKEVVLAHVIVNDDRLTLYGWTYNNTRQQEFDKYPNIKMELGPESTVKIGNGSYISNIILHKEVIRKVKLLLMPNIQNVLFVPYETAGSNLTAYKIMLSTETYKSTFSPQFISNTGFEANPSPPKNYSTED